MIEVSERAAEVLRRSVGAARRFEAEAGIRACRGSSTVYFVLATAPEPGEHAGMRRRGVVLVGLFLGALESLTSYYVGSGWREAPGLLLLILALAVRPTGVFGQAVIRKV